MTEAWKIVFVDDEKAMLDALRNLLRKERGRWSMTFHLSAKEALEAMSSSPPDVVVSDMRMPGMDGAAFLAEVKQRFPASARLVLSGQADREAIIRALPVAHQFLDKPCDTAALKAAIERACTLQKVLEGEQLRQVVGKVSTLPPVPELYQQLVAISSRPDAGMAEVAEVLQSDVAMSGKVLQLVNSSFFGTAQRITSVSRAVSYLGIELIKGLVLSAGVFGNADEAHRALVAEVQQDAIKTAQLARRLLEGHDAAEDAVTGALLHDIGKLVVATGANELYQRWQSEGGGTLEAEQGIWGATHAEIGAYLLGVWGLPFSIVEAVAHHHQPSKVAEGDRAVLAGVHAAAMLAGDGAGLDVAFLEAAGFGDQLDRWRAIARES